MQIYTVQSGDSLSKIAQRFGFSSHEPIWRYNTRVVKKLTSDSPDKIPIGCEIVIPKTAQQYDDVIEKMKKLQQSVKSDFQEIAADLDGAKRDVDRYGEKLDFAAEMAMVGKKMVKATLKVGSKRLRNYALKKQTLEAAQKAVIAALPVEPGSNEGMVIAQATGAAVDNSIMVMANRNFNAAKAKDKFAKGMAKGMAKKGTIMIAKGIAPVEHADGIAGLVSMFADAVIGGLDSIKPSNVAKTWIWATTGESPDDAYNKAKKHIAQQQQASLRKVEEILAKLAKDKKLIYS